MNMDIEGFLWKVFYGMSSGFAELMACLVHRPPLKTNHVLSYKQSTLQKTDLYDRPPPSKLEVPIIFFMVRRSDRSRGVFSNHGSFFNHSLLWKYRDPLLEFVHRIDGRESVQLKKNISVKRLNLSKILIVRPQILVR